MLSEMIAGIILFVAIFIIIIIAGEELFFVIMREQVRYFFLIVFYAPLPRTITISKRFPQLALYLLWAIGENTEPVSSVHIRHTGRFRYGKKGRWMNADGEAFFSLAVPGFVWHTRIAYLPGIWIDTFDYYVHRKAGMLFNLFSFIPLNNAQGNEIKPASLFRYLANAPLFPMIFGTDNSIAWESVDESTARVIVHDNDLSTEALVHFDGSGRIRSIESFCRSERETDRPAPGHSVNTFAEYSEVHGYKIPMRITSEFILPDGEHASTDVTITSIEYAKAGKIYNGGI